MRLCSIPDCSGKHEARGLCEKHYARFKRTGDPSKVLIAPVGGAIDNNGYKRFAGKLKHVAVAEKAFGRRLPAGAVVHHVDYNKLNNTNSNLVVCSRALHRVIHMRTDALNACGHADWRKCTICKKYDAPENMYCKGRTAYHRSCRRQQKLDRNGLSSKFWLITAFGKTQSLFEWAANTGINRTTIATRIKELGWTAEAAVSKPSRPMKRTQSLSIK